MKVLLMFIAFCACSSLSLKLVDLYNYKQKQNAYIKGLDHVDPEVMSFQQKIYNFNIDLVADHFFKSQSCQDLSNTKTDIYLSVNRNVYVLNLLYDTKEKIQEYYVYQAEKIKSEKETRAFYKKMNEIQKQYHSIDTCMKNVNTLKSENKTWNEYFRESYELIPEFKEVEYKKDILVAVIDTGATFIDPILADAIPAQYKANISKLNFSGDTDFDIHSHGTHVAGIILGVMPKAKILPLKYYNPRKSGEHNLQATLRSLEYAIDQNVDIINYSGGGPLFDQREYNILKKAQKKGILIVAAAGNERSDIDNPKTPYYPAGYNLDNIVVIGNSEANWAKENNGFERAPSSNYGRKNVDFFMKGKRVKSLVGSGDSCGMGYSTGTSMSTPVFTGIVASLKSQYPELSYKQIIQHLTKLTHVVDTNSRYGYLELSRSLNTPIKFEEETREIASTTTMKVK